MTFRIFITAFALFGSLTFAGTAQAQFSTLDFPVFTFPEDNTGTRSKVLSTEARN